MKTHVKRILMKLQLRDRVHAVVFAYEVGLLTPGRWDIDSIAPENARQSTNKEGPIVSGGNWKEMYLAARTGDLDLVGFHVQMGVDVDYAPGVHVDGIGRVHPGRAQGRGSVPVGQRSKSRIDVGLGRRHPLEAAAHTGMTLSFR